MSLISITKLLVFLFIANVPFANIAYAANFTLTPHNENGCIVNLDGIIEKGDVDKLVKLISHHKQYQPDIYYYPGEGPDNREEVTGFSPIILCLNSPGGSTFEALKIVRYMSGHMGTLVPREASCESACALIFMAGSELTGAEENTWVNRKLHATATLGFHAPSLEIPDGEYNKKAVKKAYAFAVSNIASIQENLDLLNIPSSLLIHMLKTPASEMFYINTVGKSIRWNISIVGTTPPSTIGQIEMERACLAGIEMLMDDYGGFGHVNKYGLGESLNHRDTGRSGEPVTSQGNAVSGTSGGYLGEGTSSCHFYYNAHKTEGGFGTVKFDAEEWPIDIASYHLFHPNTKLRDIARVGYERGESVKSVKKLAYETTGTCRVLDKFTVIDENICTVVEGANSHIYIWPSDARTVVQQSTNAILLNGSNATLLNPNGKLTNGKDYGVCILNHVSGNVFCFEKR